MKKNSTDDNNGVNNEVVYSSEEQAIIDKAKPIAIKYLKDTYELEVEITGERLLPTHVASQVIFEGNVVGNKEQNFSISVNYKTNEKADMVMSPELAAALRAKGYDPSIKKK
ncbi:hypothetical protein [Paenibacillus dakarensis]|uniref:hypothetical protein n=1 Tax=Paenibacillus dakarensis TaxID=1527293 RepID=UPI0006D549D1|nr:hypothetical protein [Paenibacillus dakarensis]